MMNNIIVYAFMHPPLGLYAPVGNYVSVLTADGHQYRLLEYNIRGEEVHYPLTAYETYDRVQ
jgi:hypothetical protein